MSSKIYLLFKYFVEPFKDTLYIYSTIKKIRR